MKKIYWLIWLIPLSSLVSFAGTITFKDGTRISDAEIISIKDGKIVLRKDKKDRVFDLDRIESYYQTDFGGDNLLPGEFANYKITIHEIKMPESGKDNKGKKEKCTISYSLIKIDPNKNRFKAPYFYLFVLTSPGDGDGERKVFEYAHPENARTKSKNYDEAAILKKVNGFDRRIIDYDEFKEREGFKNMGDRQISFDLDGIDKRKIIAYKLEVWGNDSKILEKSWKSPDHRISDTWWLRND